MANGEVLRKRYIVYDQETGEPVEHAFVLEPREDRFAESAMHVYFALCGHFEKPVAVSQRLVHDKIRPERREALYARALEKGIPEGKSNTLIGGPFLEHLQLPDPEDEKRADYNKRRSFLRIITQDHEIVRVVIRERNEEAADGPDEGAVKSSKVSSIGPGAL